MKNVKTGGLFMAGFIVLILSALAGIWWGISSIFASLTGDELRSDANATLFVVAILFLIVALMRADDKRTAMLARVLCGLFVALGAVMFIANAAFQSVGGDLQKTPEALAWAIPATWTLPVLIGLIFFVLTSLDIFFGTDKQPIVGASSSKLVSMLYDGLYNVGILAALVASAFGTYEVMHAITGSFWHSMIYVGTVELAIYVFASFTHRTQDQEVFWYTFGLTIFAFGVAMLFQGVSAFDKLSSGINTEDTAATFAKNFVLLPPIIMGAIAGGLYLYNQRKTHVPFKQGNRRAEHDDAREGRGDKPSSQGQSQHRQQAGQQGRQFQRPSGQNRPERPQGQDGSLRKSQEQSKQNVSSNAGGENKNKREQHERHPDDYMPNEVSPDMKKGMIRLGYADSQISELTVEEVLDRLQKRMRPDGTIKPKGEPQGVGQSKNGSGSNTNFR